VTYVRAAIHSPAADATPRTYGVACQRRERDCERRARHHAVAVGRCLIEHGCSHRQAADYLKVAPRTLRDWQHDFTVAPVSFHPLGRPLCAATPPQRNEVIHILDELGPGIGLPTLRDLFPELARAALADVLHRYRALWRRLHRQPIHVLHWTRPGSVWAADFHGPRPPVDGVYPDLLAVRDLASGRQLLWLPVRDACAATLIQQLLGLFIIHGAPLVLKCDNGSAFGSAALQALLRPWRVKTLFSPPRLPSYNGSIEAGIGSLTSRTEQHACRRGYPGDWTLDDVEAGRREANACARPRGPRGPSPEDLWAERTPVTGAERDCFMDKLASLPQEAATAQGGPLDRNPTERQRRAKDRQLIGRALVELGYLHYTRRRITPPIPHRIAA
jgi:transposase InsO family protein